MSIPEFLTSKTKQQKNIIVLGGGLSIKQNEQEIIKYAKYNKSYVMSANYTHKWIESDLVHVSYSGKMLDLISQKPKIKQGIVIRENLIPFTRFFQDFYQFYTVCDKRSKRGAYSIKKIELSSDGHFDYFSLGNTGFSLLVISAILRPKSILAVGFDGPEEGMEHKFNYNGDLIKYPPKYKEKMGVVKQRYFSEIVLPFLIEQRIHIETFKNDKFWCVDKKRFGIESI